MIRSVLILTKELNKCPNCGHQFKDGEEYCPNCDLFIPVSDQTDADNTFDPNQTKQFKTFKEIETTKNETEQPTEYLFKHRNIKADSIDESEEKPVSQPETTIEEVPSEPVVETPSEKEDIITSEKTPDTEMVEDKELSVESEETIDLDATVPLDFDEEDLSNDPIPSTQTIEPTTPKEDDIEGSVSKPLETSISSRQATNEPKKKTTRNAVIGLSAAALLAIGGFTVYSSQQKKAVEKDRIALVDTTKNAIDSLFSSKDQVFLKDGLSKADFDLANKDLEKLKGKEGYDQLKESYDEAEAKFNKQQGLNDLFKSPIIKGKTLESDVYVKNSDNMSLTRIEEEKDGFDILFNKAFDEAKKQKDALKKVEDKIAVVYKDDSVVKSATREQLDEAQSLVKEIPDEEVQKEFLSELKKVDTFIAESEKSKKEAEALALEAQQNATPPAAQNNTNTQGNTQYNNPGTNNRWGNRQDAVIDYNDPAWAWNPGIQEKVMTEVINRGYVVEGGYTLVPKYIENGEGYYDLYATTNSKIFPKSKPEEFPLYVVTINVKTGWFKGNGPN